MDKIIEKEDTTGEKLKVKFKEEKVDVEFVEYYEETNYMSEATKQYINVECKQEIKEECKIEYKEEITSEQDEQLEYVNEINRTLEEIIDSAKIEYKEEITPEQDEQLEYVNEVNRTLEEIIDSALSTGSLGLADEGDHVDKRLKLEPNNGNVLFGATSTSVPMTDDNQMKCLQCSFIYTKQRSLKLHHIVHTTKAPYQCSECKYETSYSVEFNYHIRTHTFDKPYQCQYCQFCSNESSSLNAHIRLHHLGTRKHVSSDMNENFISLKCNMCHFEAISIEIMNKHKDKVHTNDKCMKCDKCKFIYTNSQSIKHHQIIHTTKAPYQCAACDYVSSNRGNFNRHIRSHSDDKPYLCHHCDHTFNAPSYLKSHIKTRHRLLLL